ncbi:MAG: UTP--glucose-1-phosphate uridylyltransferase [Planctomycetota bacterium]
MPWYIMTSPLNHDATVAFFDEHDFFGLERDNVAFFQQGVMPSLDKATGKMLLADKGTLATNPDGHGGALLALFKSGAIDDMKSRGVEHISYFQVDNPSVRVVDPIFLGLHASAADSSAEMSSKMIPKAEPKEKVGVFCRVGGKGGRTAVIEYSDMPDELAEAKGDDGQLKFLAGSIAIHAISVKFVERIISDPAMALPFHLAIKKVPHIDLATGETVTPDSPNAVKLEKFIFDAIPLAEHSVVFETDRVEEFSPVKNQDGVDSIVSSKRLQTERAARWLEGAGVKVPRDSRGDVNATIELSALTALSAEQLRGRDDLPAAIEPGASVSL